MCIEYHIEIEVLLVKVFIVLVEVVLVLVLIMIVQRGEGRMTLIGENKSQIMASEKNIRSHGIKGKIDRTPEDN